MELDTSIKLKDDLLNGSPNDMQLYKPVLIAQHVFKIANIDVKKVEVILAEFMGILMRWIKENSEPALSNFPDGSSISVPKPIQQNYQGVFVNSIYDLYIKILTDKDSLLIEFCNKYPISQVYAVIILQEAVISLDTPVNSNLRMFQRDSWSLRLTLFLK